MERHYSRQLDSFIESTLYATSYFKATDSRTWVQYFKDSKGLIHSGTFNYSILKRNPTTEAGFREAMLRDPETTVNIKVN